MTIGSTSGHCRIQIIMIKYKVYYKHVYDNYMYLTFEQLNTIVINQSRKLTSGAILF